MNTNPNVTLVRNCIDCTVELRDFAVSLIGDPFEADWIVSRALLQNKSKKGEKKDVVDLDLLMSDVIGLCLDRIGCSASAAAEYGDSEWEEADDDAPDDDEAPDDGEAPDDEEAPDDGGHDLRHDECALDPIVANDREACDDVA